MPLLTFAIYTCLGSITLTKTVAVNILMSFTLYSLLCLYNMSMNDVILVENFNDWLTPILNFSLRGE